MVVVWRTDGGAIVTHRVVGMPGDRLEMRNFMLLVNGLDVEGAALRPAAHRPASPARSSRGSASSSPATCLRIGIARATATGARFACRRDRYFVLGDNRYGSRDSRQRGFVRRDQIVARVRWVFAAFDPKTHGPRFDRMGHDVP